MRTKRFLLLAFLTLLLVSALFVDSVDAKKKKKKGGANKKDSTPEPDVTEIPEPKAPEPKKPKMRSNEDYFPGKSYNIYKDNNFTQFTELTKTTNHSLFYFVYFAGEEKGEQIIEQLLKKTLVDLEGYVKFFVFDCNVPQVKLDLPQFCEKESNTPFFQIIKPPMTKTNPYTGKPMPPETISYNT
jgi:hypothetical protein